MHQSNTFLSFHDNDCLSDDLPTIAASFSDKGMVSSEVKALFIPVVPLPQGHAHLCSPVSALLYRLNQNPLKA